MKGLLQTILFNFIEKKYVQLIACIFSFEKLETFLKDFSVENLETTPSIFLLRSIFFELLIIGVPILHYLNVRSVQFSLVSIRNFFLRFFLLYFFFFYRYFPWQTLTIHTKVFHFHQLTNIHLVDRNYYHFFKRSISNYRLIAGETCFP